jgi:DNA polymerase-3 subunit delta
VHFRRIGAFSKALSLWSSSSVATAMAGLSQAERNCKRTGAPDHTLSRHVVLTLARRAMAAH